MSQAMLNVRPRPVPLPGPIRRMLGQMGRRLRAATLLGGSGRVGSILAIGAAMGMGADYAGVLPLTVRWAIWGAWLTIGVGALIHAVLRPLARGLPALDLAAVAERTHPGLGERLTGAVALLGSHASTPAHGSPALIAALADEAAADAATVDPTRAVPLRRPARGFAIGLILLGLVAAPAAAWPSTYGILVRRFLAPWADLDRIGRFVLDVTPGDRVAAIGADLTINARIRPRFGNQGPPEDAWLEWAEAGGGAWHRVAMPVESPDPASASAAGTAPAPTRSFAVTLPRLTGSMTYRVTSGSAASRTYRIDAIDPPAAAALAASVEPPAYTRLPAANAPDPSRIEAWEGSRVALKVTASRPVEAIEVDWPAASSDARSTGVRRVAAGLTADGRGGTATVDAEATGTFAVTLRDAHGLVSPPGTPRRLIVRVDAAPVVAVAGTGTDAGPAGAQESSPEDVLTAGVAARDDVAVSSIELHYAIERDGTSGNDVGTESESEAKAGSGTGHVAVKAAGLGTRAARGEARLELRALGLKPGDRLSYRARVADNRPGPRGPNVTWSPARSLAIVAAAESLEARRGRAERARLQAKLDELKKAAAANRRETEQLRYAADAVQRGNGRWERSQQQALDQREVEARGVADRLQLLARELADAAEFRPMARPARQIAEVEAESSRAMLGQARRAEDHARRFNDLRQADHRLAAVVQRLDDLQRQFDALARRDADLQKLRDLAGREESIADRAGREESTADRGRLDQLRAEQDAVRDDLDALLKASPELRGDVLADQADEADALARKAHELARRQGEAARQAVDVSKQAGTLEELAEAQRTLEEDARRLALEVDPPLVENGRARFNTEPFRVAVGPIERGDLDQARQRLEAAEAEARRLARDLADVPSDPHAIARRLSRRQEALNAQVKDALSPSRDKAAPSAEEKAARAASLRSMADRQEAIAVLADAIPAQARSGPKKSDVAEALRDAAAITAQAVAVLRDETAPSRAILTQQDKARSALGRLAAALPDPAARGAAARKPLDEARRLSNEVARDLDRHLRETGPRPKEPSDPARTAEELARRLAPLIEKQAKVANALDSIAVQAREAPQKRRAALRATALADAIGASRAGDVPSAMKQGLRDALPGLQVEARTAIDRLEQKLAGRVPADDLAAELADDQRALRERLAHPFAGEPAPGSTPREADDQRRIATALRNLEAPDAPLAKAEAVRLADRAARALSEPDSAPGRDPTAAVREATEAAEALAARLDRDSGPEGEEPAQAAAVAAAPVPADPELGLSPAQASMAEQLARRERQLRERLQATLADRVASQQDLRDAATALGRELADLRDRARPLSDRARGPAQEAAQTLGEQAPRTMDQGADRLAQGQVAAARDAQRQAAAVVDRGAHQAEDLAAALRDDRPPTAPAGPNDTSPRPLASARAAMRQAAQQLDRARNPAQGQDQGQGQDPSRGSDAAQGARQAMQQAARDLRVASRRGEGDGPNSPGSDATAAPGADAAGTSPGSPGVDPRGALAGPGDADPSELKALVASKTGRAWGELPGHLRTEILQMPQGRYRDDYARLIQLYFREIAAGAGKPDR